jgi:copper chaperone
MQEIVIRIQGMTCGGCVASVRRVLGAVPGVAQAEVSLEKGEARVRFHPALADSAALKGAIEAAGFSAN